MICRRAGAAGIRWPRRPASVSLRSRERLTAVQTAGARRPHSLYKQSDSQYPLISAARSRQSQVMGSNAAQGSALSKNSKSGNAAMNTITRDGTLSEQAFAALVEDLTARGDRGSRAGHGPASESRARNGDPGATEPHQLEADDATLARARLVSLLREDHPVYKARGAEAIARMRGWVLLALGHLGIREPELLYVLEELDNGNDPYLVATAARALRTYRFPTRSLISVVEEALQRVRHRDYAVNLRQYGGEGAPGNATTAAHELEYTLNWLCGPASVPPSRRALS